jgi:hypothetical protein
VRIDATNLSPDAELEADIAVVGSGPAGITLALELADAGHSVVLLESGAASPSPDVQRLGDTAGGQDAHMPMSMATRRQIGGASNIWGGRCVPFDPVDFVSREIAGNVSWPVGYEELARYFARACLWCLCGEDTFDAADVPALAERSLIPGWPRGEIGATALERWSPPANFRRQYLPRLEASPLITLATGLTCTEIACAPEGTGVDHLLAQTLRGSCATIRAARYVLACGGLEGTRLLFASNRLHPDGIGNHSGHLGRWYMAHIEARVGRVHFTTPPRETIYGYERDSDGVYVRRRFTFAPHFLIANKLPNAALWLENEEIADPSHGSGPLSLVYLMLASPLGRHLISEGIRKHQLGHARGISNRAHLANVLRHLLTTVRFALALGYARFLQRGRRVPGFFIPSPTNSYLLLYHGEHLPDHSSRVFPTSARDALGVPRLETRLRIEEANIDGAIRAYDHFDRYLRRHSLGHLEYLYADTAAAIRERFYYGCHQAGTTRMSAHPGDGVVDPDLAVHGFEDLFIASSSTFVTSGQANSTFMIVAFALRLADHLRRSLAKRPPRSSLATLDR